MRILVLSVANLFVFVFFGVFVTEKIMLTLIMCVYCSMLINACDSLLPKDQHASAMQQGSWMEYFPLVFFSALDSLHKRTQSIDPPFKMISLYWSSVFVFIVWISSSVICLDMNQTWQVMLLLF